jgi:hypothetical protein
MTLHAEQRGDNKRKNRNKDRIQAQRLDGSDLLMGHFDKNVFCSASAVTEDGTAQTRIQLVGEQFTH